MLHLLIHTPLYTRVGNLLHISLYLYSNTPGGVKRFWQVQVITLCFKIYLCTLVIQTFNLDIILLMEQIILITESG
jgi:hypothetical protein